PALAAEIPETGEEEVGVLRIHRDARAAGRQVRALQDERPGLAAVGGLVEAAVGAVRPELARHAGVDDVAVLRMDENPHDALGLLEAHVGPGLAAVGGLVDAVADRDRVPGPRLAGADPHRLRVRRVDGDRADRLHRLLVEDRLESGAAVERLPDAARGRADEEGRLSLRDA